MKKLCYLITLSSVYALISACSPVNSIRPFDEEQAAKLIQSRLVAKPTQQMIALTLPPNEHWKKIDDSQGTIGTPFTLLPEDESLSHWSESIRTKISGFIYKPNMTARKFVQNEIDAAYQNCLQVDSKILAQTFQSVTYRLDISGCKNERNQMQVGKAFNGVDAIYLVRYTAISGQVAQSQILKLSQVIKNARLVHNPRYRIKK